MEIDLIVKKRIKQIEKEKQVKIKEDATLDTTRYQNFKCKPSLFNMLFRLGLCVQWVSRVGQTGHGQLDEQAEGRFAQVDVREHLPA